MSRSDLASILAALFALGVLVPDAFATVPRPFVQRSIAGEAAMRPWHGPYYHPSWGRAVPLVVPPNSNMHTEYSWGVTMAEMQPIYHQFSRGYPGSVSGGASLLRPPPYSPASTRQRGVYYIRAPW